jgi:hypothetical protein
MEDELLIEANVKGARFRWAALIFLGVLQLSLSSTIYADDAVVLPKGFSRLFLDTQFYLPFDKKYNQDGNPEPLGADLSTSLNSRVFTALAPLNPFVGGNASLGNSQVDMKRDAQFMLFQPAYGVTDKFTVGINIPYYHIRNIVNARVDSSASSGANVGKNAAKLCGAAICPLSIPGTQRMTTNDVQNLIGGGLDVNGDGVIDVAGLGFKRVETWDYDGVGDVEIGGRYQYFSAEYFRAAFTGGVRLPTGRKDDPDNLVDVGIGAGTYALLFQFNQDFMFQPDGLAKRLGFPGPGTFLLNWTVRYDLNLPDKENLRVCSVNAPACTARDNGVRRDLGDNLEVEISPKVGILTDGLILSGLYRYGHHFKDHYTGNQRLDYGALSIESERSEHIYVISLSYTTIPLVMAKKFPFPMSAAISYRDRFAGDNNAVKSQYIGFTVQTFF